MNKLSAMTPSGMAKAAGGEQQPNSFHLTSASGVRTEPGEAALIAQALLYIERRIGKSDAEVTEVMREAMRELLGNAGVKESSNG